MTSFQLIDGIAVFGAPQEGAVAQIRNCQKDAVRLALMADHHPGYAVPIGGVVAYDGMISPSGVGYDIGCGNKAVLTNLKLEDIRPHIADLMDRIVSDISFGVGQRNQVRVDHELFDEPAWNIPAARDLKSMAREQLGTVGSGNHYIDIFFDESERIWIGVHFGSRGLGHRIATHYLTAAGARDGMNVPPVVLSADSALGSEYLACMQLAGRYAYAGRDWVCDRVATILGASIHDEVHNHHNYAWEEEHDGQKLWVVRKGATPAFPGQRGFVGGTMGEPSVILRGIAHEEGRFTLNSTVHGAGRVLSRTAARGKFVRGSDGKRTRQPGMVQPEEMMNWVSRAGVTLRGAGLDEAPQCYKRLTSVLDAHRNTVEVLHTLTPIGVAMAGENEFDPYRD